VRLYPDLITTGYTDLKYSFGYLANFNLNVGACTSCVGNNVTSQHVMVKRQRISGCALYCTGVKQRFFNYLIRFKSHTSDIFLQNAVAAVPSKNNLSFFFRIR